MANSIRVVSGTEYVIEVNDRGDTISFDPADTSLTGKLLRAFDRIDTLTKECDARAKAIDALSDEPMNDFITRNQYDSAKLIDEFYAEARKALDGFLGEGACLKIFGDKNWLTMFEELTEHLEPHFKAIGISAENLRKRTAQKYLPGSAQGRVLR